MNVARKWTIMAILCLAGAVIYILPFLREVYYFPLQLALHLSNMQLGVLMATFGIGSFATYAPGGWLADRVAPRLLISVALLATGGAGFLFATFPSYPVAIAIHAFWGVSITGVFWAAMIRGTRDWAPAEEQGRAFGILEAGRGVSEAAIGSAFLAIFAWRGASSAAFADIIIGFSALNIALAIGAFVLLKDDAPGAHKRSSAPRLSEVALVLASPAVWLIAIVVLAGYSAYWGSYYFTPHATDVFALSIVVGGAIGAGKVWLKPIGALIAGFVGDRVGVSSSVTACFALLIACFVFLAFLPGQARFAPALMAAIVLGSLVIFALRGIYFALLEEGGVPRALTGMATGIVSLIGFTPDVFMPLLGGALLDAYPGAEGYRYFFLIIAAICAAGLAASATILLLRRRSRIAAAYQAASP